MADTQPPRKVAKPVTEEDAPDNLPNAGKTPAHGVLNPIEAIPYIKRKVEEGVQVALEQAKELDVEETRDAKKDSTRKTVAGGGVAVIVAALFNFASDYRHDAKVEAMKSAQESQRSALQQQLIDHIANEEKHYGETKELMNKLLDAELKRGR